MVTSEKITKKITDERKKKLLGNVQVRSEKTKRKPLSFFKGKRYQAA